SVAQLLNLLRSAGATPFPTLGMFRLGTGNAWARVTGAREFDDDARALPSLPRPLPTRRFDLVEVDGTLCHFAGVGWDARVLNDGNASVAAVGTSPEWGFGFRAFPFAQAVPGYLNVRVYDRPAFEAALNMFRLWRGEHPLTGMFDFYVKRVRMRFSRPMPFQ